MIESRLEQALKSAAASDRRAAAEEIGESGDEDALRLLIGQLRHESSRAVKEAILRSLSGIRAPGSESAIFALLRDKDPFVRAESEAILQRWLKDSASAYDGLLALLRGSDKDLRKSAIEILSRSSVDLPDEFYSQALRDEDLNVAICAIELIGSRRRSTLTAAVLGIALGNPHPMLLHACLETLALIGTRQTLDSLREIFPLGGAVPGMFLPPLFKLMGRVAGPEDIEDICRRLAAQPGTTHCGAIELCAIEALTRIAERHQVSQISSFCVEALCGMLSRELEAEARFHLLRLLGRFAKSAVVENALLSLLDGLEPTDELLRLLVFESLAQLAGAADASMQAPAACKIGNRVREKPGEQRGRRPSWNSQANSSPS